MSADSRLALAALAYARFNFAVFPCRPRGKEPLTEHGYKDATENLVQIRAWWKRWPEANVGVATGASGIVVLDVDPRHGGDDTLAGLEAQQGNLPDAPTALTGGGGLHFYFRAPNGVEIRNSAGALGPGLDMRGDGGYVIAPPSIHASGNEYRWEVSSRIDEVTLPELPAWLLKLIIKPTSQSAEGKYFQAPDAIEAGARNNTLFHLGRSLHARKLAYDEIFATLRAVNLSRCKPPLPEREIQRIAHSAATEPDSADFKHPNPEVARLAALSALEYERERKGAAKGLGTRISVLDAEVAKLRLPAPAEAHESLAPPPPEPWPDPVEAAGLLDDLSAFIKRFVILDENALVAITLWIPFTHCFEIAETSPRLAILSPTKRCGKTRLLDLIEILCPRAIGASNVSTSAIFRTIEAESCTLLIDEADTLNANKNDELRGILNSGHTRAKAYVIRNVPVGEKEWAPKRFSTFAPVALAAIGKLPDTWFDRSIVVSMKRKLRSQTVERLTRANTAAREEATALASKLARFAKDSLDALRNANPKSALLDSDRAIDNWEHLLAIADIAGGDWPARAREAAAGLSGDKEVADALGLREMLLADIRTIFDRRNEFSIASSDLVAALVAMEQRPWPDMSRGRPLTAARLARMLRGFGVHPKREKAGSQYTRPDFEDAWVRYAPITPDQTAEVPQTLGTVKRNDDQEAPRNGTLKSAGNPTETRRSGTMADAIEGRGEGDEDLTADEAAGLELYPDDDPTNKEESDS